MLTTVSVRVSVRVWVAFLIAVLCFSRSSADVISSSQIENCILDGATSDAVLNCAKKFVVSLTVDNGQNATQSVQFTVSSATTGNDTLQFVDPWTITLSKTPVAIYYPISYLQTVNANPYEQVIYTTDYLIVDSCESGAYSDNPTCGWYKDNSGNNIPNSQGYCCSCNLAEYFGLSDDATRADLTCSFFSGSSSSAHCLRFVDTAWYDIFQIGTAQIMYTIAVSISRGGGVNDTITLSPSKTLSASSSVIARLLGDLSPFQQLPVYSSKYLAVPSSGNPRETIGSNEWMLIDTDLFDFTGTRCNVIGVSFTGFIGESGHCKLQVNSCLGYQIEDYYKQDVLLRSQNRVGNYFLPFFGSLYYTQSYTSSLTNRFLAFDMTSLQSSIVTLTFSADDIRFVTNRSPGYIASAYVDSFEALSKDGKMHVVVVNNGTINAQYEITVTQCSTGIATIQAQMPTLSPQVQSPFTFDIQSENALQLYYQCKVSLYDSQALLLDFRIVLFNTSATDFQTTAQGGDSPDNSGDILHHTTPVSCSSACSSFFNVICFLSNKCWKNLFSLLGTVGGVLLGLFILFKLKQHFGWCGICSSLASSSSSSSSSSRSRRQRKRKRERNSNKANVEMKSRSTRKNKARSRRKSAESDYDDSSYSSDSYSSEDSNSESESSGYRSGSGSAYDVEEGRKRPEIGLSKSNLANILHKKAPVYLCFSDAKDELIYKSGTHFCVMGELHHPKKRDDFQYSFTVKQYSQQTRYHSVTKHKYKKLKPPRPIEVDLFRMKLSAQQLRHCVAKQPPSTHPCINTPLQQHV